jgi:beta-galactosidase
MLHGADYNPEQWGLTEDILDADFAAMKQARVTSLSIGIFSWTLYEPTEGEFHFEWMDRLMDRLASAGISAFLATPTGSKPIWMSEKYPDIRRVARDGTRERSGFRHNHCPSSTVYREKVAIINEKLATRYKDHPALALWHLGNELQGECYCDHCLNRFRSWLEQRYQSLDQLNEAWWTRFWNHTFTDWKQIDPRDQSIDGLIVDWKRFTNDLHVEFLENEIAPLRKHTADIPVTTNYMCFHPELDYWRWSKVLDVVTNDSYPSYDGGPDMWRSAASTSLTHDLMRGLGGGNNWMQMECSPSALNWKTINKLKPRGVHLAEAAQVVAHGGNAVHYFQFRKGRGGDEKFHGAILDHDGRTDTRVFKEVAQVGEWLSSCSDLVTSTSPRAEVAILHDWESQWALNSSEGIRQPVPKGIETHPEDAYHELLKEHHRGWWQASVATDIICPDPETLAADLESRKVVLAPALYMLRYAVATCLTDFVEAGGCLILSHLSGVVDEHNRVLLGGLPGQGLYHAAGAKVEEIDALFEGEQRSIQTNGILEKLDGEYHVTRSYGLLHLQGAECVAQLKEGHWANSPIASHNIHGKGNIFQLGANFCDDFHRDFARLLTNELGLTAAIPDTLPTGVHAAVRENAAGKYLFLTNYTAHAQTIDTNMPTSDQQTIELPAFGVHLVRLSAPLACTVI